MSQSTTEFPFARTGAVVFDNPPQPLCPWYRHILPGTWTLHSTTHATSVTGCAAHISTCDGKEYCQSLKDRHPHTRAGDLVGWDLDTSNHFYQHAYSAIGTKHMYPYTPNT